MRRLKLFSRSMLGIFLLFLVIAVSTSVLCVMTIDREIRSEYEANARAIAGTLALSSVDIMVNRELASLQSLIDQFRILPGVKYIYVLDEGGDFVAHTFMPGVPAEVMANHSSGKVAVERTLPRIGSVIEVSAPVLDGYAGQVHVAIDQGLIERKLRAAVGEQVYLISILFILGISLTFWLMMRDAEPLRQLADYARGLSPQADSPAADPGLAAALLQRNDEAGELARLYRHLAASRDTSDPTP